MDLDLKDTQEALAPFSDLQEVEELYLVSSTDNSVLYSGKSEKNPEYSTLSGHLFKVT